MQELSRILSIYLRHDLNYHSVIRFVIDDAVEISCTGNSKICTSVKELNCVGSMYGLRFFDDFLHSGCFRCGMEGHISRECPSGGGLPAGKGILLLHVLCLCFTQRNCVFRCTQCVSVILYFCQSGCPKAAEITRYLHKMLASGNWVLSGLAK